MGPLARRFIPYIRNNVISASNIKASNILLYRTLKRNKLLRKELLDANVIILWDEINIKCYGHPIIRHSPDQLKAYILWNYGYEVNISDLRAKNMRKYHAIAKFGKVYDVLTRWGIKGYYNTKWRNKKSGKCREDKFKGAVLDKDMVHEEPSN